MNSNRRQLIAGSALAPLALLSPQVQAQAFSAPASRAGHASELDLPNVVLTTHENRKLRFYDDLVRGNRIVVINFIFAQCADICPGSIANLVQVQKALGARVGREVFMYSITLEPKKDTPNILAHYARGFGVAPGWQFLTGAPADIERLRRALRFSQRDPALDRDKAQHTGMVRIGNDALQRWTACPAMLDAARLAREIMWVGMA